MKIVAVILILAIFSAVLHSGEAGMLEDATAMVKYLREWRHETTKSMVMNAEKRRFACFEKIAHYPEEISTYLCGLYALIPL